MTELDDSLASDVRAVAAFLRSQERGDAYRAEGAARLLDRIVRRLEGTFPTAKRTEPDRRWLAVDRLLYVLTTCAPTPQIRDEAAVLRAKLERNRKKP